MLTPPRTRARGASPGLRTGGMIAFSMFVPDTPPPFADMPAKPEGATWAPPATTYERLYYRSDSQGFLPVGYSHVFVLPVEGGTPRQVTHGAYNHGGTPEWTPDSRHLLVSAVRRDDWEYVRDSEIFEFSVADGAVRQLTDRRGPDGSPGRVAGWRHDCLHGLRRPLPRTPSLETLRHEPRRGPGPASSPTIWTAPSGTCIGRATETDSSSSTTPRGTRGSRTSTSRGR